MTSDLGHTDRHYDSQLCALQRHILKMGQLVEEQIAHAVRALVHRNPDLAQDTIARDHTVNRIDVEIEDLCLRLLALHQPAAGDLRLITTGLKIRTDLERIGDLAVNICERALELNEEPQLKPFTDIPRMADIAQRMLRRSLEAFVHEDTALALKVCATDDAIDDLNGQLCRVLLTYMAENPRSLSRAVRLLFVSKYLERIADHAANIAKMVVFMVKGKSIRHISPLPDQI